MEEDKLDAVLDEVEVIPGTVSLFEFPDMFGGGATGLEYLEYCSPDCDDLLLGVCGGLSGVCGPMSSSDTDGSAIASS